MENQVLLYQAGIIGIVAVCMLVLLITALRQKSEVLLNFVWRTILGTLAIYFGNAGLSMLGVEGGVTINLTSVLTSGILGIPGVAALFGIFFYKSL